MVALALVPIGYAQEPPAKDDKRMKKELPPAIWSVLPRWRGFNLLEKFSKDWSNKPFVEDDFRWIAEWGFNFIRLPIDYRVYIQENDWTRFDEAALKEIDQAVEWGRQYGIHVCINLHRAPGYCVNEPKEARNLWTDPEAQRVCALHWAMFAKRYRGIPNPQMSFNLLNEPGDVEGCDYARIVNLLVAAIRREDPDRLIIADGGQWGNQPVRELLPFKVAQSTRGYQPMSVSHYRAAWIKGSDAWPPPMWPVPQLGHVLHSVEKKDFGGPLIIEGEFPAGTTFRIRIHVVSESANLLVKADGHKLLEKNLVCGPGQGEWKESVWSSEWKIYQNVYDQDYTGRIETAARKLVIEVTHGDWLSFDEIGFNATNDPQKESVIRPNTTQWGLRPGTLTLTPTNPLQPFRSTVVQDRDWLWRQYVEPFKKLQAQGVGVMVGEWGAFKQTPHEIAMQWMMDCLENWKKAGWGWALWNFRGSFGILDSGRTDATYEDFNGHQLDRKMLDLLQQN